MLRKGEFLVYEKEYSNTLLMLPQPVAMCYALLANVITRYSNRMLECELITLDELTTIWDKALEKKTVPPRFMTKEDYRRVFKQIRDDNDFT